MLAQKTGGSIVTITAALARNPIRGVTAAVPMITKGGLETVTQHLAMEYAKDGIRVNAVAPGVVDTPLHRETPKEVMESLSPMGRAFDGQGHRGRGHVPDRRRDGHGSHLVRRWRRSFRPLVMGWSVRHDVPVRWSCRTGVCHTCECGLISGSVTL